MSNKITWFKKVFGFEEKNYDATKIIFDYLYEKENNKSINGYNVGIFEIINNEYLNNKFKVTQHTGTVTLENIFGDIKQIHMSQNNATIQVASQFNCLEMSNPSVSPENGITIYENDKTQGPICAITAPAGLAYRNYIYNGGQKKNPVNMLSDFIDFLEKRDKTINIRVINGYFFVKSDSDLKKINKILLYHPYIRFHAKKLICSGSHTNQSVINSDNLVNHVYCSGLPINYARNIFDTDLWDGLSELILETMYENTLLIACDNNIKNNTNEPCYLTLIGGGVFGMKHFQIKNAIQKACNTIAKKGLSLDVKIVHYNYINDEYIDIVTKYPANITTNSVFDNNVWIAKNNK